MWSNEKGRRLLCEGSPILFVSNQNENSIGRNANIDRRKLPGIVGKMTGLCHYGHNMVEGSEVLEQG